MSPKGREPALHGRRWDRLNWLSTALALVIATLLLISSETGKLRQDFEHRLATQASLVAANCAAAVAFLDEAAAADNLAAFRQAPEILSAEILLPDGQSFARYEKPGGTGPPPPWARPLGLDRLEHHSPLELEGSTIAEIRLEADMEPLRARLLGFAGVVLGAGLFGLFIAQALMARLRRAMRRAEDDIVHLAHHDALTGLSNRADFERRAGLALTRLGKVGEGAALLFLDLDNFKVVNDSLGHAIGDRLLKGIALRLSASVREGDLCARLGGDEFTVLAAGAGQVQAAAIAEHLIRALHRPFQVEGHDLTVGASVGIALLPRDGDSVGGLLKCADSALYAAKGAGKNTWHFFSAGMDREAHHRLALEAGLRRALERGELKVVYQPVVDLKSGEPLGYEALLRWDSAELGAVSPQVFIPVAEETGLIHAFGTFVLREACAQARRWLDAGRAAAAVSVNVSPRQFYGGELVESVCGALVESRLPAAYLNLEITETALMGAELAVVELLDRLSALGVGLSLDDFGVGYASLSQLKRLPIQKLKIDRSFVMDIPGDRDDAAIVAAIVGMAQALELTVVAEGVETEEQRAFLASLGCNLGQGFLFGQPGPPP
jgi:diguanylate cyclase (GGDEF)-like protein